MTAFDRRTAGGHGREGNATLHQLRQRGDIEAQPLCAQRNRKARSVPEHRGRSQALIVRRLDEDIGQHGFVAFGQAQVLHPPDFQPAEGDRRALCQTLGTGRGQHEPGPLAGHPGQCRLVLTDEMRLLLFARRVPEPFDEDARQHRIKTRDPLRRDHRPDDPEFRLVVDIGGHVRLNPDADQNIAQILGEGHAFDLAHGHLAETQGGDAGGNAGGIAELDRDQLSSAGKGIPGQAERDDERQDRHQPDQRKAGLRGTGDRIPGRASRAKGRGLTH